MNKKVVVAVLALLLGVFGVSSIASYGHLMGTLYSIDAHTRTLLVRELVRLRYGRLEESAHNMCALLDAHLGLADVRLHGDEESEQGREEIRALMQVAACELRPFCTFDDETEAMLSEVAHERCPRVPR